MPFLGLLDTGDIPAMGANSAGAFAALTSPWNVTGQPAISLPAGVDRFGLPIGAQLVAAYGREDLLTGVAHSSSRRRRGQRDRCGRLPGPGPDPER